MLDIEQAYKSYAECLQDKSRILFIERYFQTFNASVGRLTPFTLFPRQKAFLRALANNEAVIAIKHRQAGITTISAAWIAAQMALAAHDAPETVLCIANKLEQASEIVAKIRDNLESVPRWMWGNDYYSDDPDSDKNKKDIFKKNSKVYIELFNGCKVYARASSPNAARGISAVSILIFDESAFIEENAIGCYTAAIAATASVPNKKIIQVSTPNGKDVLYYETYRQALAHENNYCPVEFKWFQDLRYNKYLKWTRKNEETGKVDVIEEKLLDSTGTVPYDEERWRELEKDGWKPTSPWLETMKASFNNDAMKIAQELELSFLGSSDTVLPPEVIEMHRNENVKDPLEDLKDPMVQETWFWKPPIEGHRYILACDPSRGDSSDFTAIEVIDMDGRNENGVPIIEQVMEYLGKKLGDEVGGLCVRYAKMYNNAYVVVDATGGVGDAALLTMLQLGYKNIFYDDDAQKSYTLQYTSTSALNKFTDKLPGFHFQGNRFPVLNDFAGMVRGNEFKVRSIRVINQFDTWVFKGEQKRMDHMNGAHDDAITCLAMGLFVMKYSYNKIQATKSKDAAILKAYMCGGGMQTRTRNYGEIDMRPKDPMMPYAKKNPNSRINGFNGNYLWLFGGIAR